MKGLFTTVFISIGIVLFADGFVTVHVSPGFLAHQENAEVVHPDVVYITKQFSHFSEDLHLDRSLQVFQNRVSFLCFRITGGKLQRDVFFITNPEGVDDEGFYRVQYSVIRSSIKGTLRFHEVQIQRVTKLPDSLDLIRREMVSMLKAQGKKCMPGTLTPLIRRYEKIARISVTMKQFFPTDARRGMNAPDYLGMSQGRHLFRCLISNADSEAYKKEWDVARGLFCYISYDREAKTADLYYTIVDYSIYTK